MNTTSFRFNSGGDTPFLKIEAAKIGPAGDVGEFLPTELNGFAEIPC